MGDFFSRAWRMFATGVCFILFGMVTFALGLLLTIFIFPLPLERTHKQKLVRYIIHKMSWGFVLILRCLGLLYFRISWQNGEIKKFSGGQLIIANHPTLLDVIFIFSVIPNTSCVVKKALWKNPFISSIVSLAGYIPNDTENLVEIAADKILLGEQVIIFPEATRTTQIGNFDFKRGAAHIAILANANILPIYIDCTPVTLRKNDHWYQIPYTPPVFSIDVLFQIKINNHINTDQPRSIQVRQLTKYFTELYRQQLI